MHSAVKLAGSRVYQSKKELAETVGPNGSTDYGYRIVNRCIKKNLLAVHPEHDAANPHGKGAVILTDKGARYLNEHTNADLNPDDHAPAEAVWSEYEGGWKHY
jgi:hypothetical protein